MSRAIQNQSLERKVWLYKNADFDTLNILIHTTTTTTKQNRVTFKQVQNTM